MIKRKKILHNIKPLITKLKKQLYNDPEILFAYVFGSYGKGKPTPISDVDIAVFLDPNKKIDYWDKKLDLNGVCTSTLKTDEVDIVILNDAPLGMKFHVIKTGKLLFSKNCQLQVNFVSRTIDLYLDSEYIRNTIWDGIVQRINQGTYGR